MRSEFDSGKGKEVSCREEGHVNRSEETRMRGPKPSYPISLTEAEVNSLQQQARAQKTGQSIAVRARIVLSANAHPEWSNQQIAQGVGTTDRNVRKWRGGG